MKARMEKYDTSSVVKKRTSKNENLYSEVGNMNIDYVDIDVDNAVELNPSLDGRTTREDYQKQRELNKILPSNKEKSVSMTESVQPKEDRVYDINEILSMARKNKLFEDSEKKRLINTEYNILTKLDIDKLENENMKKEDLRSLIDGIYEKEVPKKSQKEKKYTRSEEAKLLNDLFEDTITKDNINLQEELSKEILDNDEENVEESEENNKQNNELVATQITDKTEDMEDTTTMYDFGIDKKAKKKKEKQKYMLEGVDLKKAKEESIDEELEEKESKVLIVAIVIVVILILITCGFFVYEYFFGLK